MSSVIKLVFLPLVFGLMSLYAHAHPHAWIDVQTYVDGEDKKVYGINMVWRFDPMTSVYLLEGKNLEKQEQVTSLEQVAKGLIDNLKRDSFFTQVSWNKEVLANLDASLERVTLDGIDVVFSFYLGFDEPLLLDQGELGIQVFDPSYFIEMSWPSANDLQLSDALSSVCKRQVVESEPSMEQISQAWAMPIDASPDLTLGAVFAQESQIACQ
ncbi:hypothetical protein OA92_09575 [Marinomonas sp. SBI22]|uniref:DUF1007 family protein n=1 Tax=unclassified Marinomonas TaxID=196814 RepID=UPI0007AFAF8A|nr:MULTISPECIES: DUF1007 family protein [unclassified Marinomonas]KZM43019.1 hypothetical protein OA92_09575 [Marinomonas sp. SBI22]KZM44589.1 hypothetical protein OA91_09000 [Marinomonas sp. SBI8L]